MRWVTDSELNHTFTWWVEPLLSPQFTWPKSLKNPLPQVIDTPHVCPSHSSAAQVIRHPNPKLFIQVTQALSKWSVSQLSTLGSSQVTKPSDHFDQSLKLLKHCSTSQVPCNQLTTRITPKFSLCNPHIIVTTRDIVPLIKANHSHLWYIMLPPTFYVSTTYLLARAKHTNPIYDKLRDKGLTSEIIQVTHSL